MVGLLIAAGVAMAVSLIGTRFLIDVLRRRGIGQPIREDGPEGHQKKAGTPTMGGVAIVVAALIGYIVAHFRRGVIFTYSGLAVMGAIVAAGVVGLLDDWIKVTRERNLGLSKRAKSLGLLAVAVGFAVVAELETPVHTTLSFTRFNVPGIELGAIGWAILAVGMIYGTSNAVNLTDGLDGLAAGSSIYAFISYMVIGFWGFRHTNFDTVGTNADIYHLIHSYDLAIVAAAMLGACAGFLWWNANPARIIMGDTGSLAIGTGLAALALMTSTALLLPIIGGLFVLETLSVIIQVATFQLFGRRVFRMAPIHHHFELGGWPETTVIVRFWILAGLFTTLGLGFYYADFLRIGVLDCDVRALLIGFGVTNQAVADALVRRGHDVVVCDDAAGAPARDAAERRGIDIVEAPDPAEYEQLLRDVDVVLPSPGIGDVHIALDLARGAGVPVRSEFDLAADWDDRPLLTVTGTDGKTTVTTLTTAMLRAAGVRAAAAGNTEVPLIAAIDDPAIDVFVVEASSFRIDHSERFAPAVGTWLNFSPDHLNLHRSLSSYEMAKAKLWRDQTPDDTAIGFLDDPVVMRHLTAAPARHVTFGLDARADFHVDDGHLVTDTGADLAAVAELPRQFPHDLTNSLAAAATALAGGGTLAGCHDALVRFQGLPHRIALIGERDGVRWYDDSKATTPNATLTAAKSFDSIVLIAGGQNKGLDLRVLADAAPHVRAVVAIGDAAGEVESAFAGVRPVVIADSMHAAVSTADRLAQPGDSVLLSPACASFDWYRSYGERGDDFSNEVRSLIGASK